MAAARLPRHIWKVGFVIPEARNKSDKNTARIEAELGEFGGVSELSLNFGGWHVELKIEPDADLQAIQDELSEIVNRKARP